MNSLRLGVRLTALALGGLLLAFAPVYHALCVASPAAAISTHTMADGTEMQMPMTTPMATPGKSADVLTATPIDSLPKKMEIIILALAPAVLIFILVKCLKRPTQITIESTRPSLRSLSFWSRVPPWASPPDSLEMGICRT